MIRVVTIDLAQRGVTLPRDRVGMVIAQPFLTLTPEEPYRCAPAVKAAQLEVLNKTLSVSRARQHGEPKTHFTIFPEYSVPGLDGIALVEAALSSADWPSGTIVIGGTDALSKTDFTAVAGGLNTHLDTDCNGLERVAAGEWINCGIIWIKGADGTVERWLQPKLSPAWGEQNIQYQNMFQGRSVFAFKGPLEGGGGALYRFTSLICYDWASSIGNRKAWRWVVDGLRQQAVEDRAEQISLSWFFVIQYNDKPSHDTFLSEVARFYDQTDFQTVRRDNACLVFANCAGKDRPGRVDFYGCTSLVFSRQTLFRDPDCSSTFCNGGAHFRSSTLLAAFRDVLFRECGACIHSFAQVNPTSLTAGAAGKTIAIDHAYVFPLNGAADPRTPSAQVPACVKWLNDELDTLQSLATLYPAVSLVNQAATVHQESTAALRAVPAQTAAYTVKLAAAKSKAKHADEWDQTETEAVEHLVHTLSIFGIGFQNPTIGSEPAHATAVVDDQLVDLLAIRGNSHDECIKHSKTFLPYPRRQTLLVSRDRDNNEFSQRFGSFLETNSARFGQERRITDPQGGVLHLGYRKILDFFQNAPTAAALRTAIYDELVA